MNESTHTHITDLVRPSKGVVVVVNDSEDAGIDAALGAAAELAAASDVPCIVYDRSEETWADSQHPEGPMPVGDERLAERDRLRKRLDDVAGFGAEALAWVPSLPTLSAIETALSQTGADVVLVPEDLDRNLLERAVQGDSASGTIVELLGRNPALTATVVDVSADGRAVVVG